MRGGSRKGDDPCHLMWITKSLAVSEEDEITPGPFMIVGTGTLPQLRIFLEIFQYAWDPGFCFRP